MIKLYFILAGIVLLPGIYVACTIPDPSWLDLVAALLSSLMCLLFMQQGAKLLDKKQKEQEAIF
jgi:hypothetical protein